MKRKAYTIAEAMVTMAIIGIVASLTIPTFVAAYRKHVYANSLATAVANFETGMIEAAVVGIGINITTNKNQPEELKDIAGGVISCSKNRRQAELCAEVINEFLSILDGGKEEIKKSMQEYKSRSFLIGKEIEISPVINTEDKNFKCVVQDVTEDAKLVVKLKNGEIKILDSGEVSIHSKIVL